MTKKPDFLLKEVTFVRVNLQVVVMKEFEKFLKVKLVCVNIFRAYDDVINIGDCKIAGK